MSSNGPSGPYDPNFPQQPQQGGGYPPQQGGYPHQQGGYPPQQGGYYPPQGPPQGYYQGPPPQAPPPAPSSGGSGGGGLGKILATIIVLALIGAGVYLVPKFLDKKDATAAGDTSGEVFLEPAAAQGEDPFSSEPLADQPQNATATGGTLPAGTTSAVQASTGGTVGLYGGTVDENSCNPQKQIRFLHDNPDKAAAWVAAFNTDPTLKWPGGKLTVADIPAFIGSLTPVELQADTRVTNHGYRDGKPYAFQSILQKGTSALVDQYGVFRVRCYCGNPLTSPVALKTKPTYKGTVWQGFNPSNVKIVTPAAQPVKKIPIVDANGKLVGFKTAGAKGTSPTPSTPTKSSTPSTPSGQTTTVRSQGVPYSYSKPAGLKVQTGTSGLANGATKFTFSSNLAAFTARSHSATGFEIVDLTKSVSNAAYLKGYQAADIDFDKKYPGARTKCEVRNQPMTLGGFTGTFTQFGPCPGSKSNGTKISPQPYGIASFAGTRPDGTRVAVVGQVQGGASFASLAGSTVASFKRG